MASEKRSCDRVSASRSSSSARSYGWMIAVLAIATLMLNYFGFGLVVLCASSISQLLFGKEGALDVDAVAFQTAFAVMRHHPVYVACCIIDTVCLHVIAHKIRKIGSHNRMLIAVKCVRVWAYVNLVLLVPTYTQGLTMQTVLQKNCMRNLECIYTAITNVNANPTPSAIAGLTNLCGKSVCPLLHTHYHVETNTHNVNVVCPYHGMYHEPTL